MKANEKVTLEVTRLELVMLTSFAKTCVASRTERAVVGKVAAVAIAWVEALDRRGDGP